MNLKKMWIVIQREYLNKVKKKSFLLITFLAPVFFAAICILPSVIMMGAKEEAKQVGVIDRSGIVLPYLTDNDVTHFVDLGADTSAEDVKADFSAAGVDILLTISELDTENRTVQADCYSEKPMGMDTGSMIESRINDAVEAYRIDSYGIENLEEIMSSVKSNVKLHTYTIDEAGKETISESGIYMALSLILGMALYMFIALFSGMVMSSVIEEKSSRVVEVLMSSVKSTELMFGKIIGVAMVALTQFVLWILLTLMLLGVAMGIMGKDKLMGMMGDESTTEMVQQMSPGMNLPGDMDMESALAAATDTTAVAAGEPSGMEVIMGTLGNIDLGLILFAFLFFFVFGYLLYASMFAAIGSAVENEGEATQLQLPVTIPLMLAFFIALYAFKAPDSSIVFWGSMIPFTSPIAMLARIPFGVPTWQLVLSMVILVLTFLVCAWGSAKIYKVGILMYGKKSTFKDLWKWLNQR
ncbi:MAG: ABC transporter permease [Bacteroidales bacterium]|nr:ABC transporter permease [Bacteroidales bacterium]